MRNKFIIYTIATFFFGIEIYVEVVELKNYYFFFLAQCMTAFLTLFLLIWTY